MTQHIVLYPIIVHLLLAILLLFAWNSIKLQKVISAVGSILSLLVAVWLFTTVWNEGTQTIQSGNWKAPFGITFVADTFAATMVLLTGISGIAVSYFSVGTILKARMKFGYLPILHFLLLGLNGAFLTGDIFNLYVWFEIIIISSFVLITLGGEKKQLEGAVKYFTLNIFASVIFLTAVAVLYGLTGSLNMADLSLKVAAIENRGLVEVTAILFLIGFGIKAAIFPLYFWLPASYHTPPPAVSALFGGLLTKVGVYALIRVFTLIFVGDAFLETIILTLAGLTLFVGAVGALVQNNIAKIFSYLIISHIGFMILGLGLYTEAAIAGAIFYIIHDIVVKTNLFMVSGLIYRLKGTLSMKTLGGIYAKHPLLSLLMLIPLFSVVGIPPLSGFWPKLSLITESFKIENFWLIGAIIFATFITLFVIARIWSEVFWKEGKELPVIQNFRYFHLLKLEKKIQIIGPIAFLAFISLYIGFGAENIQQVAERVGSELLNNQNYIESVLGKINEQP
ncbi:proton-conducting transporter membrane subunit [uncultured Planktosalinus sp.]|uniref:proton-conducting transporter transmembrane domain-containing protein n=1 Tax=uncultured Planktosalinus sp. TaxID=1810935 RepID=UPI0030D6DA6E